MKRKQGKGKDLTTDPLTNPHGSDYHIPVLLRETIEGLSIVPGGVYVDCTFGGGGHSKAILEKLGEDGRLIAFDQDESAASTLPIEASCPAISSRMRAREAGVAR